MKHSKFSNFNQFGLNPFTCVSSPAEVRPNLYGVD
jgi:hypothetical protein